MYRLVYLAILLFSTSLLSAQNEAITESSLLYRKQVQFGFNLNSAELGGLNFRLGYHKTDRKKNIIDFELARVRDSKETRVESETDNPQRYTYNRINMAFFLRTGIGQYITLTERPYKNAFGLHLNYHVGVTTAFLKPIYIDYLFITTDQFGLQTSTVRSVRYNPEVHNQKSQIIGNSSFFTGMSNTTAKFGGYGRASLSVTYGQYPDEFHSIEAGVTLDVFPDPLPLMANASPRNLFFLFFVGYTYGINK